MGSLPAQEFASGLSPGGTLQPGGALQHKPSVCGPVPMGYSCHAPPGGVPRHATLSVTCRQYNVNNKFQTQHALAATLGVFLAVWARALAIKTERVSEDGKGVRYPFRDARGCGWCFPLQIVPPPASGTSVPDTLSLDTLSL